jgi:hypothetical protein
VTNNFCILFGAKLIDEIDFELDSPPTDTPSRVKFHSLSNRLVVASWDFVRLGWFQHLTIIPDIFQQTLRVYDTDKNELLCSNSVRAPVLDGAFGRTHDEVYGVSVDQTVREYDPFPIIISLTDS